MKLQSAPYLSKSKFVAGCQCLKRLYWQINTPENFEPDPSQNEAIFSQGYRVGELARQAFPGGVLVSEGPFEHAEAVERTRQLLYDPDVPIIFEAAFTADRIKVRVDVLVRDSRNNYRLIEVKQSTQPKDYQILDVAIQHHVLRNSGVSISQSCLMLINTAYVYDGITLDLDKLFVVHDISPQIVVLLPELPTRLALQWEALARAEAPDVSAGDQCDSPYTCEFFSLCNQPLDQDHVQHLPRLSTTQIDRLAQLQVESITEIPADFKLSPMQARARRSHQEQRTVIEPAIRDVLATLRYPLFFMDFETVSVAIPTFAGTRPYQQIPFQWSVQVQQSPGDPLIDHAFLAEDENDPREQFLLTLLNLLETGDGHIVVYNQTFEATRLRELAVQFPSQRQRIDSILRRMWDLLPVVRNHVYHPQFCGSFSIKSVLPALVPGLSYEDLCVADGNQASQAYLQIIDKTQSDEQRKEIRKALLAYCRLDTQAMHEILRQIEVHTKGLDRA